jgi:hypothetical protein
VLFGQQLDQLISSSIEETFRAAKITQSYKVVSNVPLFELFLAIALLDEECLEIQFEGKTAEHVKRQEKRRVILQLHAVRVRHHCVRRLHVTFRDGVWLFRMKTHFIAPLATMSTEGRWR